MKTIDAFGDLRIDGGARIRARLIELTPMQLAAFPEGDPETPILIQTTAPYLVKGRSLSAETLGGGLLEFRRASCGCQTPTALRGPRSRFLSLLEEPADA